MADLLDNLFISPWMLLFQSFGNFPSQGKYIRVGPKGVLAVTIHLYFSQDNLCILSEVLHFLEIDLDSCARTCSIVEGTLDYQRRDLGSHFISAAIHHMTLGKAVL